VAAVVAAAAASFIMPLKLMMVSFEQAFTENWLALKSFEKKVITKPSLSRRHRRQCLVGKESISIHSLSLTDSFVNENAKEALPAFAGWKVNCVSSPSPS
jgi:hypothetical protein